MPVCLPVRLASPHSHPLGRNRQFQLFIFPADEVLSPHSSLNGRRCPVPAPAARQADRPSIVIAQVERVVRHRAGAGHGHRLRRRDDSVAPLPAGQPACPMACPYALGTPGGGCGVGGGGERVLAAAMAAIDAHRRLRLCDWPRGEGA